MKGIDEEGCITEESKEDLSKSTHNREFPHQDVGFGSIDIRIDGAKDNAQSRCLCYLLPNVRGRDRVWKERDIAS